MRILFLALVVACRGGASDDDTETTDSTNTATTDTTSVDTLDTASDTGTTDTAPQVVWLEQTFEAPESKKEDIVFVIDNSCSMSDNQSNLAGGFPSFLDALDGLDWRVAVTSTDMDSNYGNPLAGRFVNVGGITSLDNSFSDIEADQIFTSMVSMGTRGSGEEKGIAAAYAAVELHGDGANASFFREDAGLHFIVLSDEQDQSDLLRPELVTLPEFINWLDGFRTPNRSVSFSSIVCTASAGLAGGCLQFDVGSRYMDVTAAIGGLVADINDPIDPSVQRIGANIAAYGGLRELVLDEIPTHPDTIEVLIDGVALDAAEWSYDADANSVLLVDAAPDGAELLVRWQA